MKTFIYFLFFFLCIWTLHAQNNVGIGITVPEARLHVEGDPGSTESALFSHVTFAGFADIRAVQGLSIPADGYGYGGFFEGGWMGLYSTAHGGAYAGTSYGVYGQAFGSAGTRIGIYGHASGGSENWAGYFNGRGRFMDDVILDQNLEVHQNGYFSNIVTVSDTLFNGLIHTPWWMNQEAGRDVTFTIDRFDDAGYTAVFRIKNGAGNDLFASAENGNARTYGNHYIDSQLGVGTQFPSQQLDVDNGNLVVQGTGSFDAPGEQGTVFLGSVHHYIKGEYGYGVKIGTFAVGDAIGIQELTGNVSIGTMTPANTYKLSVDGKIMGEELKIQDSGSWPDYVFEEDYPLMPLEQLQNAIKEQGHLPGIPSAQEVEEEGIMVGDMQKRMMEKIEELTLYVLDLNTEIKTLKAKNTVLEEMIANQN